MQVEKLFDTAAQNGLVRPIMDVLEGIGATISEMADGLGYFGDVISIIFSVFGFLGIGGTALFLLSLILLGFVGAFSPLSKTTNYLLVVAGVTTIIIMNVGNVSEAGETTSTLTSYLTVMLVPLVAVYGLRIITRRLGRGSETEQLREAVTELTEQVAALRRDRQGENAEEDRGGIRGRYQAADAQDTPPVLEQRRAPNLRIVRRR